MKPWVAMTTSPSVIGGNQAMGGHGSMLVQCC